VIFVARILFDYLFLKKLNLFAKKNFVKV